MKILPLRLAFDLIVLALFVGALVLALDFRSRAAYFPVMASAIGSGLCLVVVVRDVVWLVRGGAGALPAGSVSADSLLEAAAREGTVSHVLRGFGKYMGWFLGFLGGIWVIGLPAAAAMFTAGFVRRHASFGWRGTLVAGAASLGGVLALTLILDLALPPSVTDPVHELVGDTFY